MQRLDVRGGELLGVAEAILDNISDAYCALNSAWEFAYVNRQAETVLGRGPGELLGKNLWTEFPGLCGSPFEQLYRAAATVQQAGSLTAYYPDHQRWYEVHALPAVEGISIYFRDVSARIEGEAALQRSEARYSTLINSIDDGYCIIQILLDAAGKPCDYRFLEVNPAFEQQTGLHDPVGKTMLQLAPEHEAHWFALYGAVALSGKPLRFENEAHALERWYDVYAFQVDQPSERKVGVLFKDITARKHNEAELKLASQRKDEFLAMLAHELRNPLAPISAAVDLLKLPGADPERIRRTTGVIARQVKHMTGLIDDLLDVSRVTRGLVMLDKVTVDLKPALHFAIEQVRPLIDERRHQLRVQLPAGAAPVLGDQKRLVQVLANLLNNAAKFTPPGGQIDAAIELERDTVRVTVTDNGIGMTPQLRGRVFDLFSQGQLNSDRLQGGLGLGLSLVRSLVELHQGSVMAQSRGPGAGSTFSIWLPRAEPGLLRAEEGLAPVVAAPAAPQRPRRLLIVDDNADAARALAGYLEAAGHQVAVEHDPVRALQRATAERPDACLLDIGLPGMDGHELARRLRRQPETAAMLLVAITGYGHERDRKLAQAAGFDHHFIKPVDGARLTALLAEWQRA